MDQLTMTLVRKSDPATSYRAAEHAAKFSAKHESKIFNAIFEAGFRGANMPEIADATGLEPVQVGRRLCAMGRRGVITRTIVNDQDDKIEYEARNNSCVWRVSR